MPPVLSQRSRSESVNSVDVKRFLSKISNESPFKKNILNSRDQFDAKPARSFNMPDSGASLPIKAQHQPKLAGSATNL